MKKMKSHFPIILLMASSILLGAHLFDPINVFSEIKYPNPIGVQTVLVIPVMFTDEVNSAPIESIRNLTKNLNKYFNEVSYNKVSLKIDIIDDWIDLGKALSYYGKDDEEPGDDKKGNNKGRLQLAYDAIKIADKIIDFSNYEYIIFVHSGKDQAKSNPSNKDDNIWSYSYWGLNIPTQDGLEITKISIVSEESSLGVWVHEFLHQIGELPDFWSGNENDDHYIGIWSPLDMGVTLGVPIGSSPPHLTSWSKIKLGWVEPYISPLDNLNFIIAPIEISQNEFNKAIMITLPDDTYYLIEARKKIGFDEKLPSEGILIYFVDERSDDPVIRTVSEYEDNVFKTNSILEVGESYSDFSHNIEIRVISDLIHGYEVQVLNREKNIALEISDIGYIMQPFRVKVKILESTIEPKLNLYVDDVLYKTSIGQEGNYQVDVLFSFEQIGNHVIKAIVTDPATGRRYEIAERVQIDLPQEMFFYIFTPIIIIISILIFMIMRYRKNELWRET